MMKLNNSKKLKGKLLVTGAMCAMAGPVMAQDEEIIVTATKRAQTLQEVPVAVSVVNADVIEQSQIIDLIDLQSTVPSLRVTQLQNSVQTNFVIRGFGNGANNPGIESSVGVFVDGVFRSRSASALLDLPTLERVEVLRGPQSTLFGKNVSVGAISITTKKPEYELGGSVEAGFGNFAQVLFKGTLTGPISDTLAFRVSGSINQRDGYFNNTVTGDLLNDRDRWSARAQLLWEPSDVLSFRLIGEYNRIDEICCGAVQIANGGVSNLIAAPAPFGLGEQIGDPSDPFAREVTSDETATNELTGRGGSLQADWDLGFAGLTSITAYREQTAFSSTDIDFTSASIASTTPSSVFETFTQEVRLVSTADSKLDWLIGGFFFSEDVFFENDITFGNDIRPLFDRLARGNISTLENLLMLTPGTLQGAGQGNEETYTLDNRSFSFFGQADYHLTERLTVTGGIAYINDRREYTSDVINTDVFSALDLSTLFGGAFGALAPFQFLPPFTNFPNPADPNDDGLLTGDKVTYTARAAFEVNENINTYFTYSTGWKAGATNLSRDSRPPDPVTGVGRETGPEDVRLFELGVKANFNGGYLNIAVFDQTVDGFQSNLFTGTGFNLSNAGKQRTRGFEVDAVYQPWEPLTLTFAATYLDPEFVDFANAPCVSFDVARCGMGEVFRDRSGDRPGGIPPLSISTSATYNHQFSDQLSGYVRAEYFMETETTIVDNVPDLNGLGVRDVSILNMSAGLTSESGLEVIGWVRNATNDEYFLSAFPTVVQAGSFSAYPNTPRTFGFTIRKRF